MIRSDPYQPSAFQVLSSVVLVIAALYFGKDLLIPLALAILLSFALAPLLAQFQQWGLPRIPAVIAVVLLSFSLIGFVTLIVAQQVIQLAEDLPQYKQNIRTKIQSLQGPAGRSIERVTGTLFELGEEFSRQKKAGEENVSKVEIVEPALSSLQFLRTALGPIIKPLGTAGVVIVLVIFMLFKREDMRDRFLRLIGTGKMHATTEALDDAADRVSRYLFMQTIINGAHGLVFGTGLFFIGIPNAALWGLLAALLRFIPYLGPWVSALMPIGLSLAVFDSWIYPLLTLALVVVLELISNNIIEPWLYGSSTGVSSIGLIVAAVFWTWLWGSVGLILSAPLTVCLVVMGKYIPQLKFLNTLLGDEPALAPKTRFYQRLLAMDPEEAAEILKENSKEINFIQLCDTIILPALVLAEQDRHLEILSEHKEKRLFEDLREVLDEVSETIRKQSTEQPESKELISKNGMLVLCVPARDQADEVSGALFVDLLELEGIRGEFLSVDALTGEVLDLVESHGAKVVCISALPPSAVTHARYLCKRLRGRFKEMQIVVGLWGAEGNPQNAIERLQSAGANTILTTFEEGLNYVRQMEPLELIPANMDHADVR